MRRVKVGVIGVGAMGRNHVRVYSELKNAELVGIADINEKVAKDIAKRYDTKAFVDFVDLLREGVEAVSIAVPTTLHKDVAVTVAEHGVHMLIEKPIAESMESAWEIIKSAKENNVKLMVGHIERFNPAVIKLKELISKGELGDVVSISCKRVGPYSPRIRDVGIIIDLAVHDIDVISYLYGEKVTSVYAIASNNIHTKEDYAVLIMRFCSNRVGIVETSWLAQKKVRNLTAIGTKAMATLDYIEQTLELWTNEGKKVIEIEKREPLKNELETFLRCIIEDKQPIPSGKDGLYALSIAVSAVESYKLDKPINLKPI